MHSKDRHSHFQCRPAVVHLLLGLTNDVTGSIPSVVCNHHCSTSRSRSPRSSRQQPLLHDKAKRSPKDRHVWLRKHRWTDGEAETAAPPRCWLGRRSGPPDIKPLATIISETKDVFRCTSRDQLDFPTPTYCDRKLRLQQRLAVSWNREVSLAQSRGPSTRSRTML